MKSLEDRSKHLTVLISLSPSFKPVKTVCGACHFQAFIASYRPPQCNDNSVGRERFRSGWLIFTILTFFFRLQQVVMVWKQQGHSCGDFLRAVWLPLKVAGSARTDWIHRKKVSWWRLKTNSKELLRVKKNKEKYIVFLVKRRKKKKPRWHIVTLCITSSCKSLK